ncbi:hypothetical protein SAMN05421757_10473 [Tropicimonas sediminicola]|uniref:Uncharacterized protein n=1 Tax=Tropicimonas sediminicola TaxID=1031541 RepID=A0A239HWM7_9RHOB|nr:hypothetical protein SAMN05421757_10473 [Tropicimonas sediminicola]
MTDKRNRQQSPDRRAHPRDDRTPPSKWQFTDWAAI